MAFDQKKYLDLAGLQSYDAKIKAKIDAADQAINTKIGAVPEGKNLAQMVADETARAKDAELENKTAVETEKNRAEAAEQALTNALADEATTARAAEKANADALVAEVTRAKGVETELNTNLGLVAADLLKESQRAEAAEKANADNITAINTKIGTVPEGTTVVKMIDDAQKAATYDDTTVKADIAQNKADIATEKARAEAAEADLADLIEAEETRALAAEIKLTNDLADEVDRATKAETALQKAIDDHEEFVDAKLTTLIGNDANKSVRTIANEELAAQLIGENAKESLDTLEEIAAWIQNHPDDAAAMNKAIEDLEKLVGALPEDTEAADVVGYIKEVVAAEKARAELAESGLDTRVDALETAIGEGGSVGTQIDAKIAELDADKKSADVEEGKGIQVEVKEVDGKLTEVIVTGNYANTYDALGAAAAAQAAAATDATTKANTAKSEAIAQAADDATTKADAAKNDANAYTDSMYAAIKEIDNADIEALFKPQQA